MAIAAIVVVLLLLMTPSVQSVLKDIITSPFRPRYPEEASFTLERTLTIDAHGGTVQSFTIDMAEPMNIVENGQPLQIIHSVDYSVDVERSTRYGHNWTVWSDDVPFSGKRTMTATYEVTARTVIWDIDAAASGNLSDIPVELEQQYMHDEWIILPEHPDVVRLSKDIVGDEDNVYLVLRSIYDWIRDNIAYSTSSGHPQDALETMSKRKGDCDDQSILFCSLARAAGVPAWLQLGAMYVTFEKSWGGHAWLQAYVPLRDGGGEAVVIDPVNGEFMVWRPNRFAEFTDDGDAEHLKDYYYILSMRSGAEADLYDWYEALSYKESDKKVSQGPVLAMDVIPSDRFLVPSRT
jgi:transglutaminase-like putative cysteine protease